MTYNQGLGVAAAEAGGAVRLPRPKTSDDQAPAVALGCPERTATHMYAIVKTGGKQYRVEPGQRLLVERLPEQAGADVALQPILYRSAETVFDADGLSRVRVSARVVDHVRGPKLRVFKFKPKRGYRRRTGHRQDLTRIEVTDISMSGETAGPADDFRARNGS